MPRPPAKKATARKRTAPKPDRRPPANRPAAPLGRPSRVHDADLRARFLALIRTGMFKDSAAKAVRVPRRTMDDWLARGRASVTAVYDAYERCERGDEVPIPDADEPYHTFWLDYDASDSGAELTAVSHLHRLMGPGVNSEGAIKFYLERRWPDRWAAPGARVLVTGDPTGAPIQVEHTGRVDLWTLEDRIANVIAVLHEAGAVELADRFVAAGFIEATATDDDGP